MSLCMRPQQGFDEALTFEGCRLTRLGWHGPHSRVVRSREEIFDLRFQLCRLVDPIAVNLPRLVSYGHSIGARPGLNRSVRFAHTLVGPRWSALATLPAGVSVAKTSPDWGKARVT